MKTRLEQMSAVLSKEALQKANPHMTKLSKYVEVKNNRYYLNLSERECQNKGISLSEYDRMVFELRQTNQYLAKEERNSRYCLNKSNDLELSSAIRGQLVSTDQFQVSQKIFIPKGYKKIKFTGLRPKVTLGTVGKVGVSVMGGEASRNDFFVSSFIVREGELPLKADNCPGEVFLQISAFAGGSVWWELQR